STDLEEKDWEAWDFAAFARDPVAGQREVDRVCGEAARFLLRHTKAELFDRAVRDGILLAPANTVRDLLASPQLAARAFFQRSVDPDLPEAVYPGPFARFSATPIAFRRAAPRLGEVAGEFKVPGSMFKEGRAPLNIEP